MTRFERITPERVLRTWGVVGGLILVGTGVGNLYLASILSGDFRLFGADGFLLAGVIHVVGGTLLLAGEYLRQPVSAGNAD